MPLTRLVVDANRILSALLKDGSTRAAILETDAALFAPDHLKEEVALDLPEIARRVGVTPGALSTILGPLLERIEWVGEAAYAAYLPRARKVLGAIDPKDVPYLACALWVEADAIWSLDLHFDRQELVPRVPHPEAKVRKRV